MRLQMYINPHVYNVTKVNIVQLYPILNASFALFDIHYVSKIVENKIMLSIIKIGSNIIATYLIFKYMYDLFSRLLV